MSDRYLSVSQSAKRLGVSKDTIRKWAAEGKLRSWQPFPWAHHRILVVCVECLRSCSHNGGRDCPNCEK